MNSSVVKMSLLAIAFKGVTALSSLHAECGEATRTLDALPDECLVGLSLLQTAANKTVALAQTELPPVWKLALKPHELVEKMGSRVASLESRLKQVSKQHTTDVKVKKAEYEHELETQAKENHRIEHSIGHFKAEVHEMKEENSQLRSQAQGLMKRNNGLHAHLNKLMANMSTAHEFTETSLGDAKGKLHNATEISVLVELDRKDAEKMSEKADSRRLDEVGDSAELSLLELDSGSVHRLQKRGNAMDLLEKMNNTLNALVKEQNVSMFALKSNFDTMFEKANARMTELLELEANLNETKVNETVLQERLTKAVAHLSKVHKQLQAQVESVRGFLAGLGTSKGKKEHAKVLAAEKAFLRAEERIEEAKQKKVAKIDKHAVQESAKKASKPVSLKKNLAHLKVPAHTPTQSTQSSKSHKTSAHPAHHTSHTQSSHAKKMAAKPGNKHHKVSLAQQDKPVSKHEAAKKEDKKAKASKKAKKASLEDEYNDMIGEFEEAAAGTDEEVEAEAKADDAESEDGQGKGDWWSWIVR